MRLFFAENTQWIDKANSESGLDESVEFGSEERIGLNLASRLESNKIYVSSDIEVKLILKAAKVFGSLKTIKPIVREATKELIKQKSFPKAIGNSEKEKDHFDYDSILQDFSVEKTIKLGLIIPYGRIMGDSIIFFTAVRQLLKRAKEQDRNLEIYLFTPVLTDEMKPVYRESGLFSKTYEFPCKLEYLLECDAYINYMRSAVRSDIPWIDAVLELGGIPFETVPAKFKRNNLIPPSNSKVLMQEAWRKLKKSVSSPIVLFHREASTLIRSMPIEDSRRLLKDLLDLTDYHFISLRPIEFNHPRFTDLSSISSSFDRYINLISMVDGFVTVDTSLYHFADAFDVPGVVIFSSQPSERFCKYYCYVKAIELKGWEKLNLKLYSDDPVDVKYSESLWASLKAQELATHLKQTIDKKAELNAVSIDEKISLNSI